MSGRDPAEPSRASTPLELIFDLTFVVAISLCSSQLAEAIAAGHIGGGLLGFSFGMFGILWAWMGYTWFASAFDTDDWGMRLATLVQMIGVLVLGLGQAPLFASIEHGHWDNRALIAGYVIMRVSMIYLWLRVAKDSPEYAVRGHAFAKGIVLTQLVWVVLGVLDLPMVPALIGSLCGLALEFYGVVWVQRRSGNTTPWHPHHISERYSLLVIIALGEVVLGTTTAVGALVQRQGWTVDAGVVAVAGISLAAGIWWCYFAIPWGDLLAAYRSKGMGFGYGHMPLYAVLAAIGSGLHVVATYVEGEATLGPVGAVTAIAVPVGLAIVGVFVFANYLLPGGHSFHTRIVTTVAIALISAVGLAAAGLPVAWCLVVVMLSPWVAVAAYELRGHRYLARLLEKYGVGVQPD